MTALKILGVSGSLRVESDSARAMNLVLDVSREQGAEVRVLDLRQLTLPHYSPDDETDDPAVKQATEAATWAEAFVLASPDYHGGMSGALKNFLDYHWEEFAGKLFGYVCASHEKGLTVMEQMRTAVRQCYGWSMPYGVSVHGGEDFDVNGQIKPPRLARRVRMMGRDLVVYATLIRDQFAHDLQSDTPDTFAARYR